MKPHVAILAAALSLLLNGGAQADPPAKKKPAPKVLKCETKETREEKTETALRAEFVNNCPADPDNEKVWTCEIVYDIRCPTNGRFRNGTETFSVADGTTYVYEIEGQSFCGKGQQWTAFVKSWRCDPPLP